MAGGVTIAGLSVSLGVSTRGLDAGIAGFGQKLAGIGKSIAPAMGGVGAAFGGILPGLGAAAAFASPMMAAGVAIGLAAKAGMGFEKAMAEVKAITQATPEDFATLTATAKDLGTKGIFGPTEVAKGMVALGQAGFKTQQIIATLPHVLDFATAGHLEMAFASDTVVKTLSQFNLGVGESQRVVDSITVAALESTTTVQEMAEAFKYAGAFSSLMGYSVEDTSAALMVLAKNGIAASMGGTSLRQMFNDMMSPTKEAKGQLDALGLSFSEGGKFKGLGQIIDEFGGKLAGMDEVTKGQVLSKLFDLRGRAAFVNLLKEGSAGFQKFKDIIGQGAGRTAKTAVEMSDNSEDAIKKFMGTLELLGIEVFSIVNPAFRTLVDIFSAVMRVIGPIITPIYDLIRNFGLLGPIFGALNLLGVFDPLIEGVKMAWSWVSEKLWPALKGMFFGILAVATPVWTAIKDGFNSVFSAIWEPIKTALAPLMGIIGGVGDWIISTLGKVPAFVGPIFGSIAGAISGVFQAVVAIIGAVVAAVTPMINALVAIVGPALQPILNFFGGVPGDIGMVFEDLRKKVIGFFINIEFFATHIGDTFKHIGNTAAFVFVGFVEDLKHIFGTVIPTIFNYFAENWHNILGNIGQAGKTLFTNLFTNIGATIRQFPDIIKGDVKIEDIWGGDLLKGFESSLKPLPEIAGREMTDVEKELSRRITAFRDLRKDFIQRRWNELMGGGPEGFVGPLPDMFTRIAGALGLGQPKDIQTTWFRGLSAELAPALIAGSSEAISALNQYLVSGSLDPQEEGNNLAREGNEINKDNGGVLADIKNILDDRLGKEKEFDFA